MLSRVTDRIQIGVGVVNERLLRRAVAGLAAVLAHLPLVELGAHLGLRGVRSVRLHLAVGAHVLVVRVARLALPVRGGVRLLVARAVHVLPAQAALHHLLVGGRPVGAPAQRARVPLVPLLVARVAHGVVRVPSARRARAGRARPAVRADSTALPTDTILETKNSQL